MRGNHLALALWRQEHRERIAAALAERNWVDVQSPGLPLAYPTDIADEDDLPLAPDPQVPTRVAKAVVTLYCLEP